MPTPTTRTPEVSENDVLRAMFAARKEVFVDLLKWDLPVLDGRFEIDQFDTPAAHYLILADEWGRTAHPRGCCQPTARICSATCIPFTATGPSPQGRMSGRSLAFASTGIRQPARGAWRETNS